MPASYALHYGRQTTPLCHVNPDEKYPSMYRIHWPNGSVSDMVNLTRAKDAAVHLAIAKDGSLNWHSLRWDRPERAPEAPPID